MATHSNAYRGSSTTITLELPQKSRAPSKLDLPPSLHSREIFHASRGESETGLELSTLRTSSLPATATITATVSAESKSLDHHTDDGKNWKRERNYIIACCWCLFLAGWNDGSTGPLLPAIQEHYHV